MSRPLWIVAATLGACSPKAESPPPSADVVVVAADAGVVDRGITTIGNYDPASGMHLDDDGPGRTAPRPTPSRPGHPIDVTLRSSPPGAMAAVDGQPLGPTPTFWQGEANGRDHEFTFTLRGHASARYRFVPVASGVVHARLEPVTEEQLDAGAPMAPRTGITPPPAPPTIVSPPDAAPPKPDATEPSAGPQP